MANPVIGSNRIIITAESATDIVAGKRYNILAWYWTASASGNLLSIKDRSSKQVIKAKSSGLDLGQAIPGGTMIEGIIPDDFDGGTLILYVGRE